MAQDPQIQGSAAPQPPMQEGAAEPPGDDQGGPMTQMVIQTDRALAAIAQVLAKASPEAAQAMSQISEQFRQVIQGVMNQGEAQGRAGPSQMVSPETHGKASSLAY